VGQGAADLACPDQSNLLTRHGIHPSFEFAATGRLRSEEPRGPIALSRFAIKPNFWRVGVRIVEKIARCKKLPRNISILQAHERRGDEIEGPTVDLENDIYCKL
jgi:hypothetical protein